jgi:regulatory protein
MKIISVRKQRFKKNYYSVLMSNGSHVLCSDEIMVKYRIKPGMELTVDSFDNFVTDAQRSVAMDTALRLISLQARSRSGLAGALKAKGFAQVVIDTVIQRVNELGYLNDDAFARNRAVMLALQGKGPELIRFELQRKGIETETISDALEELKNKPGLNAFAAAKESARKYLLRLKGGDPRKSAQKLTIYLARRGFDPDATRNILRELRAAQADEGNIGDTND